MSQNIKISGVIISKNEERGIAKCINSLLLVCDEVVLVDSFSKDKTVEIAKDLGAVVYQMTWKGYVDTKNQAHQLAKHNFILSLDADEVLSDQLIESVNALTLKPNHCYEMNRLNQFQGTWLHHGGWYPDRKVRLFPKDEARWEGHAVHETLVVDSKIKTERLTGDILHYTADTQSSFEEKNLKYAKLRALERFEQGKSWSYLSCLFSAATDWFKRIVLKNGWRDGRNGFIIAGINAKMKIKRYHLLQDLKKECDTLN